MRIQCTRNYQLLFIINFDSKMRVRFYLQNKLKKKSAYKHSPRWFTGSAGKERKRKLYRKPGHVIDPVQFHFGLSLLPEILHPFPLDRPRRWVQRAEIKLVAENEFIQGQHIKR